MRNLLISMLAGLLMAGCQREIFEPFEFFYSISGERAVVISLLPAAGGAEMRTRVYPEDGEIGIGEVAALDERRILSAQELGEVQGLFRAVDFENLDDPDYIPPLDASLWAVNTVVSGDDYYTVLEPGEDSEQRHLGELMALGARLWELAGLQGRYY